jgi:hypothetical protein
MGSCHQGGTFAGLLNGIVAPPEDMSRRMSRQSRPW